MNKPQKYLPQLSLSLEIKTMILGVSIIFLCIGQGCDSENISEPYQNQAFLKYYGGTKNQTGVDIQPYKDGWLLLGSARSFGYEIETFYLLKVDQEGNEEWSLTGNNSNNNNNEIFEKNSKGVFMKLDQEDGLILLGETIVEFPNGEQFDKIFIAKVDLSSGRLEWSKIIREDIPSDEHPGSIDFYGVEGYVVVGQTTEVDELKHNYAPNTDLTDFYVSRLGIQGESIWENIYGFPYNDFAKTVKVEGNEYTVIGNSQNQGTTDSEFVMSKYNHQGGILESKQYGTLPGNIILTDAISFRAGDRTMLYGYDAETDKFAFQILDENLNATANAFELDLNLIFSSVGGIYITNDVPLEFIVSGTVDVERENNSKDTDIYLTKIRFDEPSPSGNPSDQTLLWGAEKKGVTFGGVGDDVAGRILETTDGGAIMIGTIDINTNTMMSLIRTNSEGEIRPIFPE